MLLKKFQKLAFSLFFSFMFLISGSKVKADLINANGGAYINANAAYNVNPQSMWGTGYYGGVQGCNQAWAQGTGAVDMSDEEKEERKKIAEDKIALEKAKLDKKRADAEMEFAKKKLERVFDSDIVDFIIDVHIGLSLQCTAYKDVKAAPATGTSCSIVDADGNEVASTDAGACGGKTEIPDKLKGKWITPGTAGSGNTGYCAATSTSKAGDVSSKMCADTTLRPEDASKYRTYSTSECGKALSDYKKFKIKSDNAQKKIDEMEDEVRERQYAISDAKERAALEKKYRQSTTTETDCPECDAAARGYTYSKPKRDWAGILGQVGIGLGLGFLGKKYDDANAAYSAQLGYPPQQGYPTAVSMGLPFILGGVYGAVNGTSGQGGFGCAGGLNGTGGVYGAGNGMNGPFGGAGGVYGPYGNMGGGGAFGYPQSMYGTPWGAGMYNPGYGAGGMIAGPWGGYPGGMGNGGYAMSAMINGGFMANGGYMMGNMMNGGSVMGNMISGGGGYPMNGGYQVGGYQMGGGGYPMNGGYVAAGGFLMNGSQMGGYPMNGGYQMGGYQVGGGYPMSAMVNGGYVASGGIPMAGGYQMGGYQMGGLPMAAMVNGGYQAGGYQLPGLPMSSMVNGGYVANAGLAVNGGYMQQGGYMQAGYMQSGIQVNGQYQQQMAQMQAQMQQQMMQQQMQYQQAQMQAQMQAYQRQMAVQQQGAQITQEIQSLQVRLQMLYSGAYTSNSTYNTGGLTYPPGYQTGVGGGATLPPLPTIGTVTPTTGSQITVPTNGR